MYFNKRIVIVKFTVNEYHKADNNIYSIEALDIVEIIRNVKQRNPNSQIILGFDPAHLDFSRIWRGRPEIRGLGGQ